MRRARQTRSILCLLVLVLSADKTSAQYQFDLWNTDNGLPQNSINAILQTKDGYLWLTTSDGLVRFDGLRFTVFNKGNTKGINSNRFNLLFEARDGSLWVGTDDGGATHYKDHRFTTYTTADGLPDNWVWAIREDAAGHILVVTRQGIVQMNEKKFVPWKPEDRSMDRRHEWRHRFGGLSFFDADGLHLFDGLRFKTYTTRDGLASLNFTLLSEDQNGIVWIGIKEGHFYRFKDGRMTDYDVTVLGGPISPPHEDRNEAVWLASAGGLKHLQNGVWSSYDLKLPREGFTTIYEDREGNIWLAAGDGLRRLRMQIIHGYTIKDGLPGKIVYPVYEDREGSVWMGIWHQGLSRFKDGVLTNYTIKDGLSGQLVMSLCEDRDGYLWIGTQDHGLNRFKDGQFTHYTMDDGLANANISSIYEDHEGILWVGTFSGLSRFQDGKFISYKLKDGLVEGTVQVIHEDRAGNLWLGTLGGLSCFRNGRFTNYTEQDGLSSNHIRSLYEDASGTLWIGTSDGGLNRLKDGKFTRYTTNEGLFNNGVFQILEDSHGYFWMSCNLGIYRVSRQELEDFAAGRLRSITATAYGKKDGMLDVECNGGRQPAGWKTRDGRLWFPTQDGVAVIDPEAIPVNQQPPPVIIESVKVDEQEFPPEGTIEIRPGQENLEVRYTGLSFVNSEQLKFRYKLVGLDENWVEAGAQRVAYYRYLPPGRYTFTVLAANRDGIWNTVGASLRVAVYPPFWRTWWFLSVAALSLVGLALLGYRRHVTKLKREQAAQVRFSRQLIQSQEAERKRIAGELHDGLGQNLLVIKNLALFGLARQNTQHVAQSQLGEISTTVSEAIEEVRTIARNLRPYELDRLGLTLAVESIMTRIAGSSTMKFTSHIDPIDNIFSHEAEINLYRIVQEAVNNVVKHSEATAVSITIKRDGSQVVITIRDNGKGFAPDTERGPVATWSRGAIQYESGGDLMRLRNRGFGLTGIIERVAMLNGKLSMQSSPGQGTTIRVELVAPDRPREQHEDESEQ